MNWKPRLMLTGYLLACASPAMAVEGSVYGGPVGGTDIRNAYVSPIPGFYAGFADVPGVSTQLNGSNGGKSLTARRVNLTYNVDAAGLAYVYPFRPFGITVSSAAQLSYTPYFRFSINNRTENITGWNDMYADIGKFTKYLGHAAAPSAGRRPLPYGLTVQAAYSMIFPIGRYNDQQFTTPGHNDYFIIPNLAATYLTKPNFLGDGFEFDAHLFYDHALQNQTTEYNSGDVIDLDYAVSERAGRLQYGVVGFAASQIGRDTAHGQTVPVRGRYFVALKSGPIIAYDFPKLAMTVKAKALFSEYVKNALFGPQVVLAVGFKL